MGSEMCIRDRYFHGPLLRHLSIVAVTSCGGPYFFIMSAAAIWALIGQLDIIARISLSLIRGIGLCADAGTIVSAARPIAAASRTRLVRFDKVILLSSKWGKRCPPFDSRTIEPAKGCATWMCRVADSIRHKAWPLVVRDVP